MQDSMEQQEDGWLSMPDDSSTFSLEASDHDSCSAKIITCPGCRTLIQPSYALNHASCSCGCSFCARCGTLYLSSLAPEQQPPAGAAQQQQQQQLSHFGGSSISNNLLIASCGCGAVDKAAVAARWGSAAVSCWPPEPRLQELLLLLLQQHQQQVVPLLSRQLLRRLQADTQLQWEQVQQAAGTMQQPSHEQQPSPEQQQQQQKQAAAGSAEDAEQWPSLKFMPADATPSFVSNGHAAEQRDDTMQVDGEPHSAAAATVAAALRITDASAAAAAAAQGSSRRNKPVVVQQNGPAAQVQQGGQQQEQRLLDISMPSVAAEQLQEALEQHLLLDLAADAAAAGQQQEAAAAAEDASLARQLSHAAPPGKLQAAAPSSSGVQGEDGSAQLHSGAPTTMRRAAQQARAAADVGAVLAREADAAAQYEHDGQLGLEDLLGGQPQQQGPEPMQQDGSELAEMGEQQLAAERQQRQQLAGSNAAGAVLAAKGGKLQLAAAAGWDGEDGSRPAAAAGAGSVPQLSALGLLPEAPPVLPDEPVALLLLPSQAQEEQPGHSRTFW